MPETILNIYLKINFVLYTKQCLNYKDKAVNAA